MCEFSLSTSSVAKPKADSKVRIASCPLCPRRASIEGHKIRRLRANNGRQCSSDAKRRAHTSALSSSVVVGLINHWSRYGNPLNLTFRFARTHDISWRGLPGTLKNNCCNYHLGEQKRVCFRQLEIGWSQDHTCHISVFLPVLAATRNPT